METKTPRSENGPQKFSYWYARIAKVVRQRRTYVRPSKIPDRHWKALFLQHSETRPQNSETRAPELWNPTADGCHVVRDSRKLAGVCEDVLRGVCCLWSTATRWPPSSPSLVETCSGSFCFKRQVLAAIEGIVQVSRIASGPVLRLPNFGSSTPRAPVK